MRHEAGGLVTAAVARYGDAVALTTESGSRRSSLTFRELGARANRLGSGVRRLGLQVGDRVGVLSHNRSEVVEAWLGFEAHGLVRVGLHSHFDMAVHAATITQLGVTAVLFDTRFTAAIDARRAEIGGVAHWIAIGPDAPPWAVPYESVLAGGEPDPPGIEVDDEDPAFVALTTGTTGTPKPWILTQRSWRGWIRQNVWHLDTLHDDGPALGPDDVNLHVHALQWATGGQTLYPYLLRGARTVVLDDSTFDPAAIVDTIERERVTGVLIPAPMLPPILDLIEARPGFTHRLDRVVIFFATPELLQRVTDVLGPVWCHGFGSTEQGAVTTRLRAADATSPERLASVGRPASPFLEVAVADPEGRRLAPGEVGEIVVRSEMSNSTYWEMPERTEAAFLAGGWFRTEDIGYQDADGFLYYLDRAKDRIDTDEGVVYPHLVESVVLRHPAVANCGAVGLELDGTRAVVVAVELRPGVAAAAELAEEIRAVAVNGLAKGRPARVVVVEALPTVLGGAKVQREVLRDQLIEAGS